MFGSSPSSELWQRCWQTCKPHTWESWAPHYVWPFLFASQKASAHSEQRRRRQASCPRRASGRVCSCLMGSAQWVMGHKFKRSAKLTESPALLSSPPTLMRASSCAAPVKSKSLLGAGRPGPHLLWMFETAFPMAVMENLLTKALLTLTMWTGNICRLMPDVISWMWCLVTQPYQP